MWRKSFESQERAQRADAAVVQPTVNPVGDGTGTLHPQQENNAGHITSYPLRRYLDRNINEDPWTFRCAPKRIIVGH